MRVHHLNCGSMHPVSSRLVNGVGGWLDPAHMVCHVLLVETEQHGLVLVDAGLGSMDLRDPVARLGKLFAAAANPARDEALAAVHQVRRLGFQPEDVRHIVLTHMDLDHAGGLVDFPHAKVHVHALEHSAATAPQRFLEKHRYLRKQWAHAPEFRLYKEGGEPWNGFQAVRQLDGLPPEILLVPLAGHTRGHTGVAVRRGGRWLLHAGDAYFFHGEVDGPARRCPAGLRLFQRLVEMDRPARLGNQDRLRQLAKSREVTVFSAHCPVEHGRLAGGVQLVSVPAVGAVPVPA